MKPGSRKGDGVWRKCPCGTKFYIRACELRKAKFRGYKRKFCSKDCQWASYKGNGNPKWRGGTFKTTAGYVYAYAPNHPAATRSGYVMKHRLVAEAHLGRFLLPEEEVHHKNKVRDDNRWKNLKVMSSVIEHRREHADYKTEPCGACGAPVVRSAAHRRRYSCGCCDRVCAALYGSAIAAKTKR